MMPTRSAWATLALSLLAFAISAPPASAEACIDPIPSVQDEYADALFVADATVVSFGPYERRPFLYKGRTIYEEQQKVRFRVHRAYKGQPGREFTIWSSNTSARLPYDAGDRLLVFVGSHGPDHHYVTSCGNTAAIGELAPGALSAIEALAAKR